MDRWKIRIDQQGNVDQGFLQNQFEQKAQQKAASFGLGCIISLVMAGLAFVIIAGLGIYIFVVAKKSGAIADIRAGGATSAGASGAGAAATWDGKSAYSCGADDNVIITGTTASIASGPAISAGGNCKLTLKTVHITSDTAISAMGNAVITIDGGDVTGKDTAISALGNSQINVVNGAKVSGKVTHLGNAKVTGAN